MNIQIMEEAAKVIAAAASKERLLVVVAADRWTIVRDLMLPALLKQLGPDEAQEVRPSQGYIRMKNGSAFHLLVYRDPDKLHGLTIDAAWLWGDPPIYFSELLDAHARRPDEQEVVATLG